VKSFHRLACALACALLCGSLLSAAVTEITLNASATPSAADPDVTNVTVVGHGFPSGSIPPANVTVTLNPTTSGSGPSGTTTVTNVTVVSGATEYVVFQVPASISVSTATAYQVSIAGTTSTGNAFASSNTAALTVNAPVKITTASPLPAAKDEVSYSETLAATGGSGTYTWAVSTGSLPAGLTLNSSTGVISGDPTAAGTTSFVIKATDSLRMSNSKEFSLTVQATIFITTTSPLPTGTVGANYSETLAAQGGGGHYIWAVTVGALPSGLTMSSAGVISGQPTAAGPGSFTIQVTGASEATASKAFTMTINPALAITTASPLPAGTVGVNYAQTLAATGGSGTYTWAVSAGTLPTGLTLAASTGAITGQPSGATTANFTIQVTDSNSVTATKAFALTINPALLITTTSPLQAATVTVLYSQTFIASGGAGGYSWSATGLPTWLSMTTGGVLSGTPPVTAVTSSFTVKVTDSSGNTTSGLFTLPVTLTITTASPLPTGQVAVSYSQTLAAVGGSGTYTWTVSVGSLPTGLTLGASTGAITGQPTSSTTGNFTIQVQDSNLVTANKAFTLPVNPALLITTTSPLQAATVTVAYSQTFIASGGAGGYSWSATGLPAWLNMSTGGALTGTPPVTAVDATFTVKVTDSGNNSTSGSFTVPVTLAITTASPLPTGQVGVSYAQTMAAVGGTGAYTWTVSVGSLPAGLTLAAATGAISGQPTAAIAANFTIQVQDSNQVTAALPFALTINPAASILTLSPNSSNAGLSLQVSITGSYTHFVQGTSVASFGPGIAVGGGTAGQPGPITVTSSTAATAEIAISATAATGSQTVTVTTGTEQAPITNGFSIQAAIPYISVTTSATTPLAQGFSGFHDEYGLHGVEYWDPKWLAMVEPLKPGWIRFPSGEPSMSFDWETAHQNMTWMTELEPNMPGDLYEGLVTSQELMQAKGGVCFYQGTCVSDYATFLKTLGANGIVAFNGWTDNNPNSAGEMVAAAQTAGINIIEWEIDNEPYVYPKIFKTPAAYAASAYNPYYLNINAADPSAVAGVFFQGQFLTLFGDYQTWDSGMQAYTPQYWQGVSFHVYPIDNENMAVSDEEQTLNGILAHGTTEYYSSYVQPLVGENTPVFFSEVNSDGFATMPFESYIYNGIFLAEWVSRMSTIPQVQAAGISAIFLPNFYNQGLIRAVNDFDNYLVAQYKNNNNYSTNTATNPNTQFQFYYSTGALAMEIANQAINSSNATWATTVTGGPTVPIEGYDGNPVPAVFAQGYQGTNGAHYLLITNKSSSSVPMAIEVDGNVLQSTVTVSYISNASDTAQNTATAQTAVQIVTTTSPNPITVGPYSVTCVQW
jgi:hypothetical protein